MTDPSDFGTPIDTPVPQYVSPSVADTFRVPLYAAEFASDPHRAYTRMRERFGPLAPVELAPGVPATLVVGYHTAVRILHDPTHFPADPRVWQRSIPADCPVLPLLEWRPNALRSAGNEHLRYRQANVAAISEFDPHWIHTTVQELAIPLIDNFCHDGSVDLIEQYAFPLAFEVINAMLGCPPELGHRMSTAIMAMFGGVDAAAANRRLTEAILELIAAKRADPGDDITTRLLEHTAGLDEAELVHQLVVLYGAGIEPLQNLIANSVRLILTDDRFAGGVLYGSRSTRDALDEVLFDDPPLANFCISYPRRPILIEGMWLPADQPVVISMAACNNDPAIKSADRTGNRSHLAWSAGPHACPAQSAAYLIAQGAIDQLLDALPDMQLASNTELTWLPGPFHRALAHLQVVFSATMPTASW